MHFYAINKVHKVWLQQRYTILSCFDIKSAFPNLFHRVCLFSSLLSHFIVCHFCHLSRKLKQKLKKTEFFLRSSENQENYETRRYATVSTRAPHPPPSHICFIFWVRKIQSTPFPLIYLKFTLISHSHLCLSFQRGFFLSRFPTIIAYLFIIYLMRVT